MEGKYFIKNINDEISKHEHVIFYIDDFTLRYHDTRKFGKMYLVSKDKLYTDTPLSHIGLEPWDNKLSIDYLKEKYNLNIPIKTLLLNQDILTGIGNIYADEIGVITRSNNKLEELFETINFESIEVQTAGELINTINGTV